MLLYFQYSVFLFINQRRMKQQTDKRFWIPIQYISILFTTICLIGLNVHFIFIFVIALLFWLFMPAVIIACISFFYSLRCNTKHKKRLLILHIINIFVFQSGKKMRCRYNGKTLYQIWRPYGANIPKSL